MLTFPFIVSLISSITTGIFAVIVLRRWWKKRRPYHLAWGIGLVLYFIGTFAQVVLTQVWSPLVFGLWYWTGALMVAAWLGQGTVFLLVRHGNIARNMQMALLVISIMTLPWTLFLTEFNGDAWEEGADMTEIYRDDVDEDGVVIREGIMPGGMSGTVRVFSPVMNTWGTILLVGGALYSAWLFRRKQILRERVIGNWLIAVGGFLPAMGGLLLRMGNPSFKYIGEMGGAIFIFWGFWLATKASDELRQSQKNKTSEKTISAGIA